MSSQYVKNEIASLPSEVRDRLPDPEPTLPSVGYVHVSQPFIADGAKEKVAKAIENGLVSSGTADVREFERELRKFYSVPLAKACSSGYSALVIALKLGRIGRNDAVLIPSFTMVAVLNAVLSVQATPIFVDCASGSLNPSVEEYKSKLTLKTRALIVTHTYGVPANCDGLRKFCRENTLVFIEDIAEAIGTKYRGELVGTFGDFACASLYANKAITSGDGGFVLSTRVEEGLMERADSYANHGFTQEFHFVHFENSGNFKMSGIQAALVTPSISHLPQIMLDRNRIAQKYRSELQDVSSLELMPQNPYDQDTPWVFGVLADSKETRRQFRQALANHGYETRDYFFPLHLQPMCLSLPDLEKQASLPNCEDIGSRGFYLPTFYGLSDLEIHNICKCLKEAL